ncbi:hypothetical protein ACFY7C_19365 [Streptomyces sp. NPDC012769]|uniref:hypothetical protein n=1 Tax=Streptomyces sp. NPDC012769 TaxID=3364848 RepID=UPI003689BC86
MKKIWVMGYRGIVHWRYRAHCRCGWSHDVLAENYGRLHPAIDAHAKDHRR